MRERFVVTVTEWGRPLAQFEIVAANVWDARIAAGAMYGCYHAEVENPGTGLGVRVEPATPEGGEG